MITVELSPYHPQWKDTFEEEKKHILSLLKDLSLQLYHIGSTAIPGCIAKPVIDILGVTPDVTLLDTYDEVMSHAGYVPKGEFGMPQRRFYKKMEEPYVNLHIFEDTDPEVERHLRFRNYLIAHPDKMKEYSELKSELAKLHSDNIDLYTLHKSQFIKKIDILAAWETSENISTLLQRPHKTWTPASILRAMEVNLILQMTYFNKYLPHTEIVFQPDITVVRSDSEQISFNYVLATRFEPLHAKDRVHQVKKLFEERSFSWWLGPLDTPPHLADILVQDGLKYKEKNVGMYLNLDRFDPSSTNQLSIKKINLHNDLKAFCSVLTSIGESSDYYELIFRHLPPALYKNSHCFEMYLGYIENIPVTTGILVLHANVAGIYYISTHPKYRKRGYATEMTSFLLSRAKELGYSLSVLQSSHQGKHIYESLGFLDCCTFNEYIKN